MEALPRGTCRAQGAGGGGAVTERNGYRVGDRVRVVNGSEAHGDTGTLYHIDPAGVYLVELDAEGAIWPLCEPWEMEHLASEEAK